MVRHRPPLTLVAVTGVLGFLLVTASSAATEARRAAEPRRARLVELIQARRKQVGELDRAVRALRSEVERARVRASSRTTGDAALAERLAELGEAAGTVAVHGPGVEVRLSDSSRPVPAGEDPGAYRIHDRDLQLVVNALFGAGAEAVAVNDVRLVATSPIRAAGETIVVSFRPLTPPYVVRAVGADLGAYQGSRTHELYRRWHDVFGLGYRVRGVTDMQLPAYAGRVATRAAAPL